MQAHRLSKPFPEIPVDVVRLVMETAARSDAKTATTLMTVSRCVSHWYVLDLSTVVSETDTVQDGVYHLRISRIGGQARFKVVHQCYPGETSRLFLVPRQRALPLVQRAYRSSYIDTICMQWADLVDLLDQRRLERRKNLPALRDDSRPTQPS